ncbi:MAG TPA: hypothetical protein VI522_07465 [Gammaproteobacteria bacterium]|nr:hypothetical protein [Gammaproteobacteria bacterium]
MARKLANQDNVQAPDSDYPYARIKDNDGSGNGTPVNEKVYGDIHQFFAHMLAQAGMTANDLPDNDYNGFQLYEALWKSQRGEWHDLTSLLTNGWSVYGHAAYRVKPNGDVEFKGAVQAAVIGSATNPMFTLPAGARPLAIEYFAATGGAGATFAMQQIDVDSNGEVDYNFNGGTLGSASPLSISQIKFSIY